MKLLVASCFDERVRQIERAMHRAGLAAHVHGVQSADEVLHALASGGFDGLLSDYVLTDIDIWKLSTLVHSRRFANCPLPLYLIKDTGDTAIPPILSNEYRIHVVTLDHLAEALATPVDCDDFKPSLLIIEDESNAADIAYQALKEHYRVEIASDGLTGFERWLARRHDLILLDLMLPGLAGDEVLAKILAVDSDQPVIIVTSFANHENHKNLMINGASEFLGKPYTLTDLRQLCRIVYNRAKLVSEIHFREDQATALSQQLWLLEQCLAKNEVMNCRRVLQRMQKVIPAALPGEDEQLTLLQSVSRG